LISLRARVPQEVMRHARFSVDARNQSADVLTVYSGDMQVGGAAAEGGSVPPASSAAAAPPASGGGRAARPPAQLVFDPTYEIATLQPGNSLKIRNIRIKE